MASRPKSSAGRSSTSGLTGDSCLFIDAVSLLFLEGKKPLKMNRGLRRWPNSPGPYVKLYIPSWHECIGEKQKTDIFRFGDFSKKQLLKTFLIFFCEKPSRPRGISTTIPTLALRRLEMQLFKYCSRVIPPKRTSSPNVVKETVYWFYTIFWTLLQISSC